MLVILQADQRQKQHRRNEILSAPSTRIIPIGERKWTDVAPEDYSSFAYPESKQLSTLLRLGHLPREDDGAIEFWRIKDYFQDHFVFCHHWSDEKWKSSMTGEEETFKFQYCSDSSGTIMYRRALQGHSGRSLIDPLLQDNVVIQRGLFHHIYHIGCAFGLHSIINNGLIPGGQNSSKRQTVFFLLVHPMYKEHKDPDTIDLEAPRFCTIHAQSTEETSKHGVLGRHQTCSKERIKVLSDAIERHHPLQYTTSLLYAESFGWKLEKSCTKKYLRHLGLLQRFP